MHGKRETNPHFSSTALLEPESPEPPHRPSYAPPQSRWYYRDPTPPPPARAPTPPAPHRSPRSSPPPPPPPSDFIQGESFYPQRRPQQKPEVDHIDRPTPAPQKKQRQPKAQPLAAAPPRHRGGQEHHPSPLRVPPPKAKTNMLAWVIAACCTVFWVVVIFGLLAILVIYIVFRPRNPKFDISSATINAAYLDMGYLLNADLTLLANFTNPNKKGRVEFHYAVVDLYHGRTPIASTYIQPFAMTSHEYKFQEIHLVTSQVGLSSDHSQRLRSQIESGRVRFEVKGLFRVRSDLGGILKYSYWLNSHCSIMVTGPPSGILIAKRCSTKR